MLDMKWSLVVILLAIMVAAGCNSAAKKEKDSQSDQTKMADAQREVRQNPDKFENSEDPPINAETHFAAGQLQESQGDIAGAMKQYRAALKLNPNNKNALYRLGLLQTSQKSYSDALLTWRQYLKATNNSAEGYNNLALCYQQAGQITDAEKNFKEGIARDPEDRSCRINYGIMLAQHGRMQEATDQLATVLKPAEVQYNLGSVLEEQNKPDEAKVCYRKALELDPTLSDAKSRLATMK
jgi:tetratricopeptide (TPR) repeat protein